MAGSPDFSPARPPNERDLLQGVNGSITWLGVLVSNGTLAVDNAVTATPFLYLPTNPSWATTPGSLAGSLAGKGLILYPTTAGWIRPSTQPMTAAGGIGAGGLIVAAHTTVPPAGGTTVGLPLVAAERAGAFYLLSSEGWLQWLSSGAGNCHVFGVS